MFWYRHVLYRWLITRTSSPSIGIDDHVRSRLIKSLGSWHFEPLKLPEEEVLACTYILFESLFRMEGMQEDAGISLSTHLGSV